MYDTTLERSVLENLKRGGKISLMRLEQAVSLILEINDDDDKKKRAHIIIYSYLK